jgi:xylan 1,4-beta-xylosidase
MNAAIARFAAIFFLLVAPSLAAQEAAPPVHIHVQADKVEAPLSRVWNYFGYDEPNYSYAPNGKKLLNEIGALAPVPAYVRVHNLLTSGDGSASLKWGSTNAYSEDANGKAIYSWEIVDRIFDAFHSAGVKPLVEIGFMPKELSTHPDPYRHNFPQGPVFTGWAYPPKDDEKWAELVYQFVRHLRQRYGDAEIGTWLWEVWNEPDIDYWKGTPEEFFKLYDYSADAVLRALPGARVGGPDTTGPRSPKAIQFLTQFLEHCAQGRNQATGKTGAPLDFISFHPKGSPTWRGDHVQMGIASQLSAIEQGFKVVAASSNFKQTPIILGESDPEGCAACSAQTNPQNAYRNGSLYASYTAETLFHLLALAQREHINLAGAVTWAFEFEDQPYFAGFRELASNGLDKPVMNAFRMFGLLGDERVKVSSSGAQETTQVVSSGVRTQPEINAIATRSKNEIAVLVWNYHDDDLSAAAAAVDLSITGMAENVSRATLEHFRIDAEHSNAFTAWKEAGSPVSPSAEEFRKLVTAGQLQLLDSPRWISVEHSTARLQFNLPRQGLSLLRVRW